MNQFQVGGVVHPAPANVFIQTASVNNNFLRVPLHRKVLPSWVHFGVGAVTRVSGTTTILAKLAGTTIATASFSSGAGAPFDSTQDVGGVLSADGDIFSVDISAIISTATNQISVTGWFFHHMLARFTAGLPVKVLAFDLRGNAGAAADSSHAIKAVLYKTPSGGSKTAISTLNSTSVSSGDFSLNDSSIGSVGELAATDDITVELESIQPHLKHLSWNITFRPAYLDTGPYYTLGNGAGGGPITADKFDNSKRRILTGIIHPEFQTGATPTTATNNVLRERSRRHLLATVLAIGTDAQTAGTSTMRLQPSATTASATSTGVQSVETVLASTYAGGTNVLGVDISAAGTGLARPSYGVHVIPYNEIAQFRMGFVGRILGFEVEGYTVTSAPSAAIDISLKNKTAATTVKQLNTATASSNSFTQRDDTLATNFAASDELVVQLDAVPQGTDTLAWRLVYTPAVVDA